MKRYYMQDHEISIVSEVYQQDESGLMDQVGLVQNGRREIHDMVITINGLLPVRRIVSNEPPPVFRVTYEYQWIVVDGKFAGACESVWLTRTRWLQAGIWYERFNLENRSSKPIDVTLGCDIRFAVSAQNANRLTVLWTDQMIRLQHLNSDWSFSEIWIEWNRHAHVTHHGKHAQFAIHIEPKQEEELIFRTYPVKKGKVNRLTDANHSLSELMQTYDRWACQSVSLQVDQPGWQEAFQRMVRQVRARVFEVQDRLMPCFLNRVTSPSDWLNGLADSYSFLQFDPEIVWEVIKHPDPADTSQWAITDQARFYCERLKLAASWFDWTGNVQRYLTLQNRFSVDADRLIDLLAHADEPSDFSSIDPFRFSRIPLIRNEMVQALNRYLAVMVRCGVLEEAQRLMRLPHLIPVVFADWNESNDPLISDAPSEWTLEQWVRLIGVKADGITVSFRVRPLVPDTMKSFKVRNLRLGNGTIGFDWQADPQSNNGIVYLVQNNSGYRFVQQKNVQTLPVCTAVE